MGLPAGTTMRQVNLDDFADREAAFSVVRGSELEALDWTDATVDSVVADMIGPHAWPESNRLVFREGRPVGLLTSQLDTGGREVYLDAYAVGEGRSEVLVALTTWGLDRARAVAADDPGPSPADGVDLLEPSADVWQAFAGAYTAESEYLNALAGLGFHPIRRFWRMLCDLVGTAAVEPPAPAGATTRTVAGIEDERLLHRLYHDTFAEHFGMTHEEPFEEWIEGLRSIPGIDSERWWLAELDGVSVGLCIVDDSRAHLGEGYVRTLGVLPDARGRGIARWLLGCAAADAVARGRTSIGLSVDGANTTGATALYESVGYRIRQEIDVLCCPLAGGASSSVNASSRKASPQT
jgi:ribosomal protein S18 acetylase RimI-like enzyme